MKQLLTAFFSFSRIERLGIATMALLLAVLLAIRCTLSLWVRPASPNKAQERRFALAYKAWRLMEDSLRIAGSREAAIDIRQGELFSFDPNTLDSSGFLRLGIPAKAVRGLLSWRRKGKRFHRPEDLKPLYNLPEETYLRLAPYVRIAGSDSPPSAASGASYPPLPAVIELNTADSALLDRAINGIGATLARKIVARRTALGGFLKLEQLLEVYKFPDTTFQKMKDRLHINPNHIKKLHLNTATLAELSAHPYIGEKTAQHILMYREGIGHYEQLEQLRQVPLMSEEIYRKIAPYFTVD
jgi:competence ComEA-like helix-hairpin-helix protein